MQDKIRNLNSAYRIIGVISIILIVISIAMFPVLFASAGVKRVGILAMGATAGLAVLCGITAGVLKLQANRLEKLETI